MSKLTLTNKISLVMFPCIESQIWEIINSISPPHWKKFITSQQIKSIFCFTKKVTLHLKGCK